MGEKKKMGAPTKLTKELIERVVTYLQKGAYVETAAAAAGISKETFYHWLHQGANKESGLMRDFSDAVEKAQADSELRDLEIIDKAAESGQWKASAWRLERRNYKRWGIKQTLEHISKDNETIEMSDEELKIEHERINGIINKLLH